MSSPLEADAEYGVPGGFISSILRFIPWILYWTIAFITITLPTWLFTLFSKSLTITMNATTLLLIFLVFASTISWFVRYRWLNMYARLPLEPQRKEPQVEIFPEVPEGDSKRGFSNYLDEFLSAIKVFGYLERPVFHELTRTMQTRKLIAGETLLLEEEQGFCLVVDGLVQIFVKSQRNDRSGSNDEDEPADMSNDEDDEDHHDKGNQRYQLLTEVKNGAPMSSLFSILALFTEDVKLRYDEVDIPSRTPSSGNLAMLSKGISESNQDHSTGTDGPTKARSSRLAAHDTEYLLPVPPLSLDHGLQDGEQKQSSRQRREHRHQRRMTRGSAHPDIVARATRDTTIAVIPATAFRRLTRVYPKASAHIVQVILTRLQRVTLATSHAYLGLTEEVLRTEKLMNKFTTYDLPGFLRGDALERLKEKFQKVSNLNERTTGVSSYVDQERDRIGPEESFKGIALHNPGIHRRRQSSGTLGKDAAAQARLAAVRMPPNDHRKTLSGIKSSPVDRERSNVHAGDLLSNTYAPKRMQRASRASMSQPFHTRLGSDAQAPSFGGRMDVHRQESYDEDTFFREAITQCMFKGIGLTNAQNSMRKADSVEQSPRLVSFDARNHRAVFNNAFGFMDALDMSTEGDSESIVSTPASSMSAIGSGNIAEELSRDIDIVYFPKGSILVEQGERNPGLYYVIDGFLDISVPIEDIPDSANTFNSMFPSNEAHEEKSNWTATRSSSAGARARSMDVGNNDRSTGKRQGRRSLYLTKPGGLAGYLGTISSRRSFVDVTAQTDVYVGFLPRASIERIVEKYPIVLLTMAKRLTTLLPRLILHIDFALEWVQIDAGEVLYHQGDESDAIYIVLNGRLRMTEETPDGKVQVVGEFGQGDGVGELGVLTETRRTGTVHAIRDTELAKLPRTLFNSIALESPEITLQISKIIANQMRKLTRSPDGQRRLPGAHGTESGLLSSTLNLRTVGILPVTHGVPVVDFASRLHAALTQISTPNGVTSLNQSAILNHLGRHAFNRMGKLKLAQHLADLEEKFGLVLYVADTNVKSPWTQTCISQADCILLIGLADGSPSIGEFERFLLTTKTTARKELVLIHSDRYCPPGLTRRWLRNRVWINGSHHHIQMSFRSPVEPVNPQTRKFGAAIKQRVQVLQAEIQKYTSRRVQQTPLYSADTPFKGDFHRLARRLIGRSVGLVLGGGGARGIAHIGIIRALEEAGVPIDIIGGTSIGGFIGALYAWDGDVVPLYGRAKKFAGRMGSMWRFALDLTYPSAAYTTGHEFNRGIFKTFGDSRIEDFWLEFYCNTTNISKSRPEIHRSGYVWRYVRASMSLAGLVPPLCDENGCMLLDGGYLDNLTVAHMKSLGADIIFAVDVGSIDDQTPQHYGDSLSGLWAAWNRWNPFSSNVNPPTIGDIQAKLAYASSIDALEKAKAMPGCRYMRPPVTMYGTLEFSKFEEIYSKGYEYGKEFLNGLRKEGILPTSSGTESEAREVRRTMAPRRASI